MLSLKSGKVPDLWKSANITPIHKSDSGELVKQLQINLIIAHSSKVFGADSAYCCLRAYCTLLTEWQHGFVKGRSCESFQVLLFHTVYRKDNLT